MTRKSAPRNAATAPSILGHDLVVTGDIKTDGDIQIDGRLEGNAHASRLTVGEQGVVNGNVDADAVHVRGKVNGNIQASLVEIAETADVRADIIQDQLTVANGAFFEGKCTRRKKQPTAAVAPTSKPVETKKPA
ncbi:MAG: polymer-forming cytoskeletal protein [Hyphomonadaceae bacterium]|nr:polymer-forming cytoskeletal protein [Hyphomonadaceae bacterium]